MKKTGLGKDPLSWIKPTVTEKIVKVTDKKHEKAKKGTLDEIPKFRTFEVRLTTLLRDDQLDFLDKLVREIKKNRTAEYRKERITKNTLLRVFVDAFMNTQLNTQNIPDEKILLSRVLEKIKK